MSILDWLFGKRKNSARDPGKAPGLRIKNDFIRSNDDETYAVNQDVIAGLQFVATLQIRTPLAVLEHHGEIFRGPPSKAPRYGSAADGRWIYKTKSWEELARSESAQRRLRAISEPEQEHASDVGPVKPSEYLPFLKEFRRIMEKPAKTSALLDELDSLSRRNPAYQQFWQKLSEKYQDFPKSFFYMKFTEVPGIRAKAAKAIFESGVRNIAELRTASEAGLIDVPGIEKRTLERLREHFSEEKMS